MRGLLDTSIFVAQEAGRQVGELPDEAAISVITVAELHAGVLLANDAHARAARLLTLSRAERSFESLPIDSEIARVFASMYAEARLKDRRPKPMDLWIAATAVRHQLVLFTLDREFEALPQVTVRLVTKHSPT